MLEILLKMNKDARGLNQSLEKIVVVCVGVEPEMLQYVVRFVVTLVIPAPEIGAIKRMLCDFARKTGVIAFQIANELRNSFAFVHEAFNFNMPHMMGKPTFPEGPDNIRRSAQE